MPASTPPRSSSGSFCTCLRTSMSQAGLVPQEQCTFLGWVFVIQLLGRHCLLERGWGKDVCATAKWGGEGTDARACLGDRSLLSACHFLPGPSVENPTKEGVPQASPSHAGWMRDRSGHYSLRACASLTCTSHAHVLRRCSEYTESRHRTCCLMATGRLSLDCTQRCPEMP